MTALLKICGCYLGALICFGLLTYSLETGRILLTFVSIVTTLPCLRFLILDEGEWWLILVRWPSARTPSLVFGLLFVIPALIVFVWAMWSTAIPQGFLAFLSFGFGFNFVMIGFCPDELPEQEH